MPILGNGVCGAALADGRLLRGSHPNALPDRRRMRYDEFVPVVSIFFGIVISMFYNDHDPPHFHAEYQGQRGKFDLDGEILAGNFRSQTARRLIREWAEARRSDIEANWENARAGRPLQRIEPLN